MKLTPKRIIFIWLSLLVLAVIGCIVGLPQVSQNEKIALVIGLVVASASLAAVPLFFLGLRHFEQNARRAFVLVCAGIAVYGIGSVQFPIINLFDSTGFLTASGVVVLPFVLTVGLQYFGIRRLGRLMLIKGSSFMWPLVYASACVTAVLVAFIPGTSPLLVVQSWLFVIVLCTVFEGLAIRARIADRYRSAFSWLVAGNAMAATAVVIQAFTAFLPRDHWYIDLGLSAWVNVVTAFLMVRAGYEFARIETNLSATTSQHASPVEVVMYVASLASDTRAIDKSLDRVRLITSRSDYSPDAPLDREQEASLIETYKEIETYLTQRDPVLRFDTATLRESLRTRFGAQDSRNSPFWRLLHS